MIQAFNSIKVTGAFLAVVALHGSLLAEVGELAGTVSINLQAADSSSEPTYTVAGVSLSEDPVFQGSVYSTSGNVLTFSQIQDEEDPTQYLDPFIYGSLASSQARATATINLADGNVTQIAVDYGGSGYSSSPEVKIDFPDSGTSSTTAVNAEAIAVVTGGAITGVTITNGGVGYAETPSVSIAGGSHFLRITESGGADEGRFFLITANDGTSLTLENSTGENFGAMFPQDMNVEIVPAHTLGSVFGISNCLLGEGNASAADLVYLHDPLAADADPQTGYVAHYNDGSGWKRLSNGNSSNDLALDPDEAFILARRATSSLDLEFDGKLLSMDMQAELPAAGQERLLNNPFGMDVLLTELIASNNLTTNAADGTKWYADDEEETADSLKILDGGVWTTYWHANVNVGITTPAAATCVVGTGSSNAITAADFTITSGGAGYTSNAMIYFIGGGGSGAYGTANVSGGAVTSITLQSGGSGYTLAPQAIFGTGGWRRQNAFIVQADNEMISAGAGILLRRRHPNGVVTHLQSANPAN